MEIRETISRGLINCECIRVRDIGRAETDIEFIISILDYLNMEKQLHAYFISLSDQNRS